MPKLNFHDINKRKIEFGVSQLLLYPRGKQGVAWNGIISISENVNGAEVVNLYADGIKYGSFRTAEKYEATIKAYMYPEEFEECDGSVQVVDGIKIGQQIRLPFDFCFRTEIQNGSGNTRLNGYKLHLIYNAIATPSERSYKTINDNPDAVEFSWNIQTNPYNIDGKRAFSSIVIDSTQIDKIKLDELETIIYGTDEIAPRIPDPIEVISTIQRLDVKRVFINIISRSGNWIWDTFNFKKDTVPIAIDRESATHIYYEPAAGTEYKLPSIAYSLISDTNEQREYLVIVIDNDDSSELAADIEKELNLVLDRKVNVNNLYYYQYHYYV